MLPHNVVASCFQQPSTLFLAVWALPVHHMNQGDQQKYTPQNYFLPPHSPPPQFLIVSVETISR